MPDKDDNNAPQTFTAEDLEKARREAIEQARREERDKLYGQRDKQKEQYDAMQAELAELRKAEQARAKAAEKAAAEAEKARKAKEDAEKSAKELLEQRNQEWQAQLEQTRAAHEARMAEIAQQQQVQQAMWEKEREMDRLALYTQQQVTANQDNIAPELIDLVGGNTAEEVDASIQDMIARTARIVDGLRQAQVQQRAGMPGVAPSGGATAITPGLDTGDKQLTPDDIKGMSMQDFAKLRQQAGIARAGSGVGIFG